MILQSLFLGSSWYVAPVKAVCKYFFKSCQSEEVKTAHKPVRGTRSNEGKTCSIWAVGTWDPLCKWLQKVYYEYYIAQEQKYLRISSCVCCSLGIPECVGPVPQTGGGHPIGEILLSTVCSPCHYFRPGEHFWTGSTTGKWHPFPSLPALSSAVS